MRTTTPQTLIGARPIFAFLSRTWPSIHESVYFDHVKKLEIIFGVLRLPGDALATFGALLVAYTLRQAAIDLVPGVQLLEQATTLPASPLYITDFAAPGALLFVLVAAVMRLYAFRGTQSAWREVGNITATTLLWLVLVMTWFLFVRQELFFSRILLLHSTVFILLFVTLVRSLLTLVYRSLLRAGHGVRNVVTIGRPPSRSAMESIRSEISYHYIAHADSMDAFRALRQAHHIDLVIETTPHPDSTDTLTLIDECRNEHIEYAFLPPVFADSPHQLLVDHLGFLPLVRFRPTPLDGWGRVFKAGADALLSACLLVALSPLLLIIALLILLDSGWPIFYVSRRVGQHGEGTIPVLKFRSMVREADQLKDQLQMANHRSDGPLFKVHHDPRVTRVGRLLRRWSLDELPQFCNVLCGQLALVGPRPHLPDEVQRYDPRQRRVFAVRPGVTGLAQVSGRSDLPFEEEIRLDLQYIEEWSPRLDLWILWRTVLTVLGRKGAD